MDERQEEREKESGEVDERRLRSDWNLLRKLAKKKRGVRRI